MNPFELTKDQYDSITMRIKSECVVLTREEARRIEERFIGISGENAKLRELVRRYSEYTDQDRCEGCVLKRSCNDGEIDECWQIAEIREMEKELGVLDE